MGPEQKPRCRRRRARSRTRVIQTETPRGEILDRNGKVLAQDSRAWAVTVDRDLVEDDPRPRARPARRGARHHTRRRCSRNYDSERQSPLEPAVVALDVPLAHRLAIREHREDYPGRATSTELTVRAYPVRRARVAGARLRRRDRRADQLQGAEGEGLPGRRPRSGATASRPRTSRELRGKPRAGDGPGRPDRQAGRSADQRRPRHRGDNVQLTIDVNVQTAAENVARAGHPRRAHAAGRRASRPGYATLKATGGAVVVLDAHDGSVVAMASYPTYPLSWWVGGISHRRTTRSLSNAGAQNPLLEPGDQGQYAPGSTFKLVPSIALNQYGVLGASQYYRRQGLGDARRHDVHRTTTATRHGPVEPAEGADGLERRVLLQRRRRLLEHLERRRREPRARHPDTWRASSASASRPASSSTRRRAGFPTRRGRRRSRTRTTRRARSRHDERRSGTRPTTSSPRSARATTSSRRCNSPNAYAAFANGGNGLCGSRTSARSVIDPMTQEDDRDVHAEGARPRHHRSRTCCSQMLAGFAGAVADPTGTAYDAFQGFPLARSRSRARPVPRRCTGKGDRRRCSSS